MSWAGSHSPSPPIGMMTVGRRCRWSRIWSFAFPGRGRDDTLAKCRDLVAAATMERLEGTIGELFPEYLPRLKRALYMVIEIVMYRASMSAPHLHLSRCNDVQRHQGRSALFHRELAFSARQDQRSSCELAPSGVRTRLYGQGNGRHAMPP